MLEHTIAKLYSFIARLVVMLEDELEELEPRKSKSAITVKKNITATLSKLVTLITQLNKLDREQTASKPTSFSEEDREIINCFLEKYRGK